jgi:ABC-type amino acid transport system permease subunit
MDERHSTGDIGLPPAVALGTLFVFYMVWAAMHDIAHGESDATLEYAALIAGVPAFAFLYRVALLHLAPKAKSAWLVGTEYAPDPMLASLFLSASVPVLGLIGYHPTCETLRRLSRPRS